MIYLRKFNSFNPKGRTVMNTFKANAGVKDIVGRGLIYDDNIAIIELVKNSKDVEFSH